MKRKILVAGNWKMYKTRNEAQAMARDLVALTDNDSEVEVVVFPPFTALAPVGEIVTGTAVKLGAQNVHWEDWGAYTGEVSIEMLLDCGCDYVIIGHSERRQYFQESDKMINQKIKSIGTKLIPILCVGETLEERDGGQVESVILDQMAKALDGVETELASRIVLAYEPVWAIGTGRTATPEIAQEIHKMIRDFLVLRYSESLSVQIPILYGGSVKPENMRELISQKDLDGALVGGASLEAETFARIVEQAGIMSELGEN